MLCLIIQLKILKEEEKNQNHLLCQVLDSVRKKTLLFIWNCQKKIDIYV